MTKKLTYEFVKSQFEGEGYTLLSKEYINNHTKLKYICPNGHIGFISYGSWSCGKRCAECAGNKKLTIEDVRFVFESEGYILLSKEYVNARSLLDYRCPNGHEHKCTYDNFKRGYRCPYCNGRPIKNITDIKIIFEKEDYKLLSTEYINNKMPLEYVCPYGHIGKTCLSSWYRGHRCNTCAQIALSGPGHPNWQGGKSFEPYCEIWKDKEFKLDIMERDAYVCLNPYCSSKDPNDLTIHHIDYNKQNCHPNNLITVCRSCNSRANKDREWHKAWYQALMHKKYNYKY